ncbi:MAG: hypothetical protein Q4F94_07835, partial [Dialister sp.]|nr:hypothetical protein [Dialister sp.]
MPDLIFAATGHGYDERQRHFGFQQTQNEFIGGILPAFFLAEFHSSAVYAYTQVAHGYSALSVKEIFALAAICLTSSSLQLDMDTMNDNGI